MSKIKFGLYKYSTENIGDEIQSIAARRFLPKVDYLINRDGIRNFRPKTSDKVKLIMNGWYMHQPQNWQPISRDIEPLLVSMHISEKDSKVIKAFKAQNSVKYLIQNGPIGARDKRTLAFLRKNKIPSYFSACLTLTLERDQSFPRRDYILTVDLSDKVKKEIKKRTNRPVIDLSTYYDPNLSTEGRFILAEYFLYLYQSAHCVITTRLHAALPSLAFETPVLLIKEKGKYEQDRFSGLLDFLYNVEEKEYMENPNVFNLNNPPKNKPDYLQYRNELIKKCKSFTGYSNPRATFRTIDFKDIYENIEFIKIFTNGTKSSHKRLLLNGDVKWLKEITRETKKRLKHQENLMQKLISENEELRNRNNRIESSISWKMTAPLRQVNSKIKGKL